MKHIPLSKVGKIAYGLLILGALIMVIGCCVRGAGGLALAFAGPFASICPAASGMGRRDDCIFVRSRLQ